MQLGAGCAAGGVVGDAQHDRDQGEVGNERRAAVGDERQRDAGERDHAQHTADNEERLEPEDRRDAGCEQLGERPHRVDRDAEHAADHQQERGDDGDGAGEPELLSDRGEDVVSAGERNERRVAQAEAGSRDPTRAQTEPALHGLIAPAGLVDPTPWVQPVLDAETHVAERLVGHERADDEQHQRPDDVRRTPGRHVQHGGEHPEEQQTRAHVLLIREHQQCNTPREQQWSEVARRRQEPAPDAYPSLGEQFTLVDEVRGEERDEQQLRDLARFEGQRADSDPQARSVDRAANSRCHRQQQEQEPEQEGRVAVPLEDSHVPHEDQRHDEHADGDRDPQRLHPRLRAVVEHVVGIGPREPRDHDEAEPVQHRGKREQGRVGVGSKTTDGEVGDDVQAEDPAEQRVQVGREVRSLGESDEDVSADGDGDDKHAERQLGTAAAAGQQGERHGRLRVVVVRGRGRVVVVFGFFLMVVVVVDVEVTDARSRPTNA